MLRDVQDRQDDDALAAFCGDLLLALQIPQVQDAIRAVIDAPTPPTTTAAPPSRRPAVPVRGRGGRRG